jgi:hypothetical protein
VPSFAVGQPAVFDRRSQPANATILIPSLPVDEVDVGAVGGGLRRAGVPNGLWVAVGPAGLPLRAVNYGVICGWLILNQREKMVQPLGPCACL